MAKKKSLEDNKRAVTFRASPQIVEQIRKMSKEEGLSQGDLISKLVKEAQGQNSLSNSVGLGNVAASETDMSYNPDSQASVEIEQSFLLFKKNDFDHSQDKENRKYICRGKWIYFPPSLFVDPASYYMSALKEEFQIPNNEILKQYDFFHVLNLFELSEKEKGENQKYIAQEYFHLQRRVFDIQQQEFAVSSDLPIRPIIVSRIFPVNTFEEIEERFGHYLNEQNRIDLAFLLAAPIEKNSGDIIKQMKSYF